MSASEMEKYVACMLLPPLELTAGIANQSPAISLGGV